MYLKWLVFFAMAGQIAMAYRWSSSYGNNDQCYNRYLSSANNKYSRIKGDRVLLARDNQIWVYQITCTRHNRPHLTNIVPTWRAIVGYNPSLAFYNGRVVIFKGHHWSNYPRNVKVVELRSYLRSNGTLTEVQSLTESRQHPANGMVPVAHDSIVVCGDGSESKGSHTCELMNEMALYGREPSVVIDCPLPGLWSASAPDSMGRAVITGGWYWWGDKRGRQAAALDTRTLKWAELPSMRTARHRHASALFNGDVVVCGGLENAVPLSSCERLPANGTHWLRMPAMPAARFEFGLAALDGFLWAIGGKEHKGDYKATATVFYFDGRLWHRDGQLREVIRDTYLGGISAFGMAAIPA